MSPILGIVASSVSGNLVTNSYESIQTVTVGAGGAPNVQFTSIPTGTYKHLQIQYVARTTRALVFDGVVFRVNGDSGANYFNHLILGDGINNPPGSYGYTNETKNLAGYITGANAPVNSFGTATIDITDAFSTNKNKTNQCMFGTAVTSNGALNQYYYVGLSSGAWANVADPITSITLLPDPNAAANFVQHSTFALYGIRG